MSVRRSAAVAATVSPCPDTSASNRRLIRPVALARTVIGGLLSSTVLTLVVLPTYYELFDNLALWVKRLWYVTGPADRELKDAPSSAGD